MFFEVQENLFQEKHIRKTLMFYKNARLSSILYNVNQIKNMP
jgi:hypothetical protein